MNYTTPIEFFNAISFIKTSSSQVHLNKIINFINYGDVNCIDNRNISMGYTPLISIILLYNKIPEKYILKYCDILLKRGANINCVDKYGNSILMLINNNINITNYLLQKGLNINHTSKYTGFSKLMLLSTQKPENIVGIISYEHYILNLLKNGANYKLKNHNGKTATDIAIDNNNYIFMDVLTNYITQNES